MPIKSAFYGCSRLTSITIPNSVTSIGSNAFYGCSGLTSIYYTGDIASWCGISGLYNLDKSKVYIGNEKLTAMTSITIPDSVMSIGDWAFYSCSKLTSITIGNSVTSIGYQAFYKCGSLMSIEIPNSVASISDHERSIEHYGEGAFRDCNSLKYVTIPKRFKSYLGYIFGYNRIGFFAKNKINFTFT